MSDTIQNTTDNKRIAKNTIILYIRMAVIMVVNLFSARLLLNHLGVDDYGIYNVVGGVILLMSFFSNTMSNVNQRFMCIELGKGRIENAKSILVNGLFVNAIIIVIVLMIAETIGLWFFSNYINIPLGKENDALIVYQTSLIVFIFHFLQIPFHATVISYEKMKAFSYISIFDCIVKLCIIYSLYCFTDKLAAYSWLLAIESMVILILYYLYCNKILIKVQYKGFISKIIIKKMFSFIGWNTFGQISFITANQGLNIVLNMFFSVAVNSAMGIANQVNAAVLQFVTNFQTAFRPRIIKIFSSGENNQLRSLVISTSKLSFLLLFIVSLPLINNIDYILKIWLNNVPMLTSDFCILTIIFSLIEIITGTLLMVIYAEGNIRNYQIVSGLIYLSSLPFAYFLLCFGCSPQSALVSKIIISFIILAYRVYTVNIQCGINLTKEFAIMCGKLLIFITLTVSISYIVKHIFSDSLYEVIMNIIITLFVTLSSSFLIILNSNEKKMILRFFKIKR
ncbi:MAG: lipopolysaccharide biosynthesis protein [Muribaculaceae bacterium]